MKQNIITLREQGKSYKEIVEILGCSKSLVNYYCNPLAKIKTLERQRNYRLLNRTGVLSEKVTSFQQPIKRKESKRINRAKQRQQIPLAISTKRASLLGKEEKIWKSKDLIDKIGDNKICYLTGRSINLNNGYSYQLDHITPISKGGTNELSNVGIACPEANQAKSNLTVEEFIQLCIEVLEYNGYKIIKN